MSEPVFISNYRTEQTVLVPNHATRPRRVWTAGSKGSRIHAINISTTDAAANSCVLGIGKLLTNSNNMGQGAYTGTTITRTSGSGSFITDGWIVGDRVLTQGGTTLANDAINILTTVAAATLTASGASWNAENFVTGTTQVYKYLSLWVISVPLSSGTITSAPSVDGLNTSSAPMLAMNGDIFLTLGPNDVLFAAAGTTLSASENMDISVFGGDF